MEINYSDAISGIIKSLKEEVAGKTIIVKCGGSVMSDRKFLKNLASDIGVLHALGANIFIVHGAGKKLDEMLERLGVKANFLNGYRATDQETMDIVEMVMSGYINKDFVKALQQEGLPACGLSCKDYSLVQAKKVHRTEKDQGSNIERIVDLGLIGEPVSINEEFFDELDTNYIHVITPIAFDKHFNTLSINADVLACFLGEKLEAAKVIILSENYYIQSPVSRMTGLVSLKDVEQMIYASNVQHEVMLRLKSACHAIKNGVEKIHLIDSQINHPLITELEQSTKGSGSTIICKEI